MCKKKVVFKDAGVNKVFKGYIKKDGIFYIVTDDRGKTITINQENIVFIKDLE